MIINNAMINGKEVLEMQMNNSIVYSSAPTALGYNYTLSFANGKIVTPPPKWFITKSLVYEDYFYISGSSLRQVDPSRVYQNAYASIGLDFSKATTDIKITVTCSRDNITASTSLSQIMFGGVPSNAFDYTDPSPNIYTQKKILFSTLGTAYARECSIKLSLSVIQQIYAQWYMPALNFYHSNGDKANYSLFSIHSVKIEEV